ncbi:MAG: winged helix-turn-helix domain-containing protein [Candidatus Lutacidiplasmatales archaeon]
MDESSPPTPPSSVPPPPPPGRKERILDALGDPAARGILLMLNNSPHSAQEMLQGVQVPQSTLYRKLHELQELGLVAVQRIAITSDGKRVDLYRSLLEELSVDLKGSSLRIQVRFRDLAAERLKDMWKDVRKEAGR